MVRTRRSRNKFQGKEEKEKKSTSVEQEKDRSEGKTENENDNAPVESFKEEENNAEESDDDDDDDDDKDDDDDNDNDNDDDKDDDDDKESTEETHKLFTVPSRRRHRIFLGSRNKSGSSNKSEEKNALTHLIPGYTAPMKLDSSSLDKYRCESMKELGRRAERNDVSTKDFVLEATVKKANNSMQKTKEGFLPKSYTAAYSHFKRGVKRVPDDTAGHGWFGMKPSAMTEDLKTDLAVIRNRTYLDPKRFYKSADKNHKIVQMGTVIEGASEFYSSRLTKKQRRSNLTEELMADPSASEYTKKKFKKMAEEKSYQHKLRNKKPKRAKKFY